MNDITPKYNTISELDLVEGILKNLDKYIEGMKKNAKWYISFHRKTIWRTISNYSRGFL